MDVWLYGFMALWIHGFMESVASSPAGDVSFLISKSHFSVKLTDVDGLL